MIARTNAIQSRTAPIKPMRQADIREQEVDAIERGDPCTPAGEPRIVFGAWADVGHG